MTAASAEAEAAAPGADRRRPYGRLGKAREVLGGYRRAWARLAPHLRPHRARLFLATLCTIGWVAARLLEPWPLKFIVDGVFRDQMPAWMARLDLGDGALIAVLVGALALTTALAAGLRYGQKALSARMGLELGHALRVRLIAHALTLSPRFHARRRSGDLVVRMMSDVRILTQAFVSTPMRTLEEALLLFGMLAIMVFLDWRLTLIAVLALPVAALLVRRHHKPLRAALRKQRERESQLASTAAEALSALRIVQAFGRERAEAKRFGKAAKKDLGSGLRSARLEGRLKWSIELAVGIATAALLAAAVGMIRAGGLTPGDLIVFAVYLAAFYQPVRRLSRTMKRFSRAASAEERVTEILRTPCEVSDPPAPAPMPAELGELRFERVGLDLEGRAVLEDVDLRIAAGERVALLGPSGAGKTSLVALVPRLMDPDRGRVLLGGADLRSLRLADLRARVALAPQDTFLFAGSAAENVALGLPEAPTRASLDAAAEAAGVAEVIAGLPGGWDAQVGEGGRRLSGGQRRALALVRALARDPAVLVLDEPTTGLEAADAARVRTAIERLEGRVAVILITHDLAQVASGDRVVRLEAGRIISDEGRKGAAA